MQIEAALQPIADFLLAPNLLSIGASPLAQPELQMLTRGEFSYLIKTFLKCYEFVSSLVQEISGSPK